MKESASVILFVVIWTFCNADDPSLCSTNKYRIIPKSDCQGYYFCLFGKAIDMPPCGPGSVFSRSAHVCVRKGGIYDDCTPGEVDIQVPDNQLTIEQQCQKGATLIPHPTECQLYYNCNFRYQDIPRYFEQYMQECPYPKLFNTDTMKCEEFENVNCGIRKETKDGCEYRQNQCGSAHCIPCSVRIPSCIGKSDGVHAHDDRPWSPYYITCYKERSVSMDVCPKDSNGRAQLFHMGMKQCVPLDMVPQEHGGTMPKCEGREDGNYLDDIGRCDQYTICSSGAIEEIVKCGEGKVFDALKQECTVKEKACGPCGGANNC